MNKKVSVLFLGLLLVMSFVVTVSADPVISPSGLDKVNDGDSSIVVVIKSILNGVWSVAKPVLQLAVGNLDDGDSTTTDDVSFFVVKILLMVIVFVIVWKVLEKAPFFSEVTWVPTVLGIAVSLLSIRWFSNGGILNTVLLPYSALGIALTAGLPFLIFFFVVKDFNKTARKFSWSLYITVFVLMWATRYKDIQDAAGSSGAVSFIYLIAAGGGVLMMIFDGSLQKLMSKAKVEKHLSAHNNMMVKTLKKQMKDITTEYADATTGGPNYESIYKSGMKGRKAFDFDSNVIKNKIAVLSK